MDASTAREPANVAILSQMALQTVRVAGSWQTHDVSVTIGRDVTDVSNRSRSDVRAFSRT
jgi:hypothetical protein